MPISVRPPSTAQELEQLVRLRYQVYVEEEGRFTPHLFAEPAIFDAFDTIPHTLNLLAFDEQEPAGFIRLTAESEWGSPLDAHYDLSAVRARCGAAPVTVSMLGVSRKARDRGVAQALILQVIELIHASGYTDVMVVANAQIVPLLRRYQLQEVGTPFHCPRVGQRLSMLHAPTHLLPREAHAILPGHSSRHRVRFEHGELLLHPERPQTSAYFIRRGQVRLSLPRGDGGEHILAEVGPGALIGALERTASGMSLCSAKAIGPVEVLEFPLTPLMSTMTQNTPATFNSAWQPETPQNLIGLLPRAQESMQRLLSRSVEGLAPSGVKLFNHYLAARVIHQLGELGIFRRLEQGPLQPLEVAQERGIEPTHLEALLHFLEQLGWIEHAPEGWRMAPALAHRFDAEHGFLQWLIGAYEPVLDGLPALLRGHARYGHELRRQDREVARSSARISEVYTDPAMYLLLKLEGVSTVADIGMGSGLRLIDICQRLPHLRGVGLDLSEACCTLAREHVAQAQLSERIEIVHDRAETWLRHARARGLAQVDLVLCFAMFHDLLNVPGLAEQFLRDILAGLAPGAWLLIQDQLQPQAAFGAEHWGPGFELMHHFMGQRLYPRATYLALFQQVGLELVQVQETPIPDNELFLLRVPDARGLHP